MINPGEPFNLHTFRTVIGDPARPYLFLVHIPEIGSDTVMTSLARSTTLPDYNLGQVAVPFQGMNLKLGTAPEVADITFNFLCDEAHELRKLFMKWQAKCYDMGSQLLGHANEYKSDQVAVAQLTRKSEKAAIYGLVGAWPKSVGQIQVGHDQTAQVEMFDVTFAYDYYVYLNAIGDRVTDAQTFVRDGKVQLNRGTAPGAGNFQPQ